MKISKKILILIFAGLLLIVLIAFMLINSNTKTNKIEEPNFNNLMTYLLCANNTEPINEVCQSDFNEELCIQKILEIHLMYLYKNDIKTYPEYMERYVEQKNTNQNITKEMIIENTENYLKDESSIFDTNDFLKMMKKTNETLILSKYETRNQRGTVFLKSVITYKNAQRLSDCQDIIEQENYQVSKTLKNACELSFKNLGTECAKIK